ncbi:MAG: ATP-binding protein [Proteobacteria bacterium]|nr:ATP-binding protein [Pseudomonadota bacterium]
MTATLQRTTLRTSRTLDFASEKELIAQTGHQRDAWPLVILKELVDNAIDACEEAGTAPVIEVIVDNSGISVSDNGPGLPADTIKDILDFTVRVSSREAYVSPTRGAQGNALKTVVAMPFVLDGERGRIEIEAQGARHCIEMSVDRIRQEPVIAHEAKPIKARKGTKVRVFWPNLPRSNEADKKERFLQIATQYAWLNPHLHITVDWDGEHTTVKPTDTAWKKWLPSDPTSAHWYTDQHLERLIAGYISNDADAGRERTVRDFVSEFRGLSSTAKQKAVLGATELARAPLSKLVNGNVLDRAAMANLLVSMQEHSKPVKPPMLGVIGKEHFKQRFTDAGCEMDSFQYKKVTGTTDGVPWIVETAFGWTPDRPGRVLVTGVNWSPGIINPFRELGSFGESLDTVLSEQRANRGEPVILVLHMTCPRVEYTDRGKSAVVVKS